MMRWIKKAIVSLLVDDATTYPRVQLSYNGVTTDAYRLTPYGLSSQPPTGALAVILSPDGRRDDPVALIANPLGRFKGLKEGEVQVGNEITGSFVKFNRENGLEAFVTAGGDLVVAVEAGNAEIDVTGTVTITAPTVQVDGNLVVTGTITGQTDVLGGPASTSLISHTHNETGTGGGVTGPPNP